MLKVAVVGLGGVSGLHIPAWNEIPDVELAALCDIHPEQMEDFPYQRKYTDFNEMLEKEDLDILDICLPTFLHAEHAVAALSKGIHVLCEKPISLNKEDVKLIYDTAEANHVTFMVAHVLRFWREYVLLKQIYDSEEYGKLLSGTMTRLGEAPSWSRSGWMSDEARSGLVPFDLHIHDLDFLVYAFGEPRNISSFRSKKPTEDYLNCRYDYEGFSIMTEAGFFMAPYPFRSEFRFSFEGAIVEYKNRKLTLYEKEGEIVELTTSREVRRGGINLSDTAPFANEIRYFADCVRNGKQADRVRREELESVIDILHRIK